MPEPPFPTKVPSGGRLEDDQEAGGGGARL